MLPQGIFSVAIATVLFPTLARLATRGDMEGFRATLGRGLRQIAFLLVPASVVCAVLATPMVRLLYQRGAFEPPQTIVVAGALAANGYTMDLSLAPQFSATTTLVMRCGTTNVLLAHAPNSTVDDIEVWGAGQRATADVCESLPIALHKQPPLRSALRSP
jgi:hypothetical protein